jgi:hypothetical protein
MAVAAVHIEDQSRAAERAHNRRLSCHDWVVLEPLGHSSTHLVHQIRYWLLVVRAEEERRRAFRGRRFQTAHEGQRGNGFVMAAAESCCLEQMVLVSGMASKFGMSIVEAMLFRSSPSS